MSMVCLGLWLKITKWWTNEVRTRPTPAYVIELRKIRRGCRILQQVQEEAGWVLLFEGLFSLQNLPHDW